MKHYTLKGLTAALLLASGLNLNAKIIYLYGFNQGEGNPKVHTSVSVRYLRLENDNLIFHHHDNTETSYPWRELHTISLRDMGSTAVDNIAQDAVYSEIKVFDDYVAVSSSETIQHIDIYDLSGRTIASLAPGTSEATVNFSAKGIFVIKISHSEGNTFKKIIK